MPKSPDAFRTISEVADELDVPQHVLRFWETKFTQIKPLKRAGGRRYYRPADVDLIRGIQALLYGEGYTIKGVQRILKDQGVRFVLETGQTGAPTKTANLGTTPIDPETGKGDLPIAEVAADATADTEAAGASEPATPKSEIVLTLEQREKLSKVLKKLMTLKARISDLRSDAGVDQDMPLLAQMRARD